MSQNILTNASVPIAEIVTFLNEIHIHKNYLWEELGNTNKLTILDLQYGFLNSDTVILFL